MGKCKFCENDHSLRIAQPFRKGAYYIVCRTCGASVTWGLTDIEKTKAMYQREKRKDN